MKKSLLSLFVFVFFIGIGYSAASQEMVVIVNNSNPVSTMKKIEVKLYYMRKIKKSWPDLGKSIQPAGLSEDNAARQEFLSTIMKMNQGQLDAYFKQVQFSTGDKMPPMFATENELIEFVSTNEGALAYVSTSVFNASGGKVKAVSVK